MDILFLGGTGRLSKDTAALAAVCGMDVTLLTRGSAERSVFFPEGCRCLRGDIRDTEGSRRLLKGRMFDTVVDYISYNPGQLDGTLDVIGPHCDQYIFVSSATVYEAVPEGTLISEERTPVGNREWGYSWDKYLCERRLAERFEAGTAPAYTIVRPYVTYGNTRVPYPLVPFDTMKEWSFIERVLRGLPVPMFDGGRTLTTITHTRDFAKGMVGLFGNERAYGEAFHITSEEEVTWGDTIRRLEDALGLSAKVVEVPKDVLFKKVPEYMPVVKGDKGRSMRFDNTKTKTAVPSFTCDISLAEGVADMVAYLSSNPEQQRIDWKWMGQMDRLLLDRKALEVAERRYDFESKVARTEYLLGRHPTLSKVVELPRKVLSKGKRSIARIAKGACKENG